MTHSLPGAGSRPRLVMKFGGTSVADLERVERAANKVRAEVERGYDVAVVVSAMAGETDKLAGMVRRISPLYDGREYDAVVSAGEQVSAGLMALTLDAIGVSARSWLGWQTPIRTTGPHGAARIASIDTDKIAQKFTEGLHAVIAGFQGVSDEGRITTLGRGGSDTSAVAMAAALGAERCDIYTDVDGVYTCDPRIEPKARRIGRIAYEEMLELASLGAKVLQTRSVELAMRYGVSLQVLSSFGGPVGSDLPGTLVSGEQDVLEDAVESKVVTGVAHSREEAKITLTKIADRPGVAASIFGPLADAGVNVDMIVQDVSEAGETDMTFTVAETDVERALDAIERASPEIGCASALTDRNVAKVSIVGIGMRSHTGVAQRMFQALANDGVNILVIATSEIRISVLVERKYIELAVRSLHSAFELDQKSAAV